MAIAVNPNTQTAADELRGRLAHCEASLARLNDQAAAAELFASLDGLAELWPAIRHAGVDVRGEWTRWETLQSQLRAQGSSVLAAWGGARALASARSAAAPDTAQWWWWLDELVAGQRRRRLAKALGALVAVVALAVLGGVLFGRLFPVDATVRAAYRLRTDAETALAAGDYAEALASIRQAASILPGDPYFQILTGVLAEQTGDSPAAQQAWETGRRLLQGQEDQFLLQRAMAYGMVEQFDRAEQDAHAAIALNPNLPRAYFYLGAAYEGQGKTSEALEAFTKASDLAGNSDPELTVLVRMRMAALLQSSPAIPSASAEGS